MDISLLDLPNQTVLERITFKPYKVRFEILEHPLFTGFVDNDAIFVSENETKITFSMNWKHKITNELFENVVALKSAVQKTIEFIKSNN